MPVLTVSLSHKPKNLISFPQPALLSVENAIFLAHGGIFSGLPYLLPFMALSGFITKQMSRLGGNVSDGLMERQSPSFSFFQKCLCSFTQNVSSPRVVFVDLNPPLLAALIQTRNHALI